MKSRTRFFTHLTLYTALAGSLYLYHLGEKNKWSQAMKEMTGQSSSKDKKLMAEIELLKSQNQSLKTDSALLQQNNTGLLDRLSGLVRPAAVPHHEIQESKKDTSNQNEALLFEEQEIKFLQEENKDLRQFNLHNQLMEAMVISAHRGYHIDTNVYQKTKAYAVHAVDTVEIYIGFNPDGLSCDYKSDLTDRWNGNRAYTTNPIHYGSNTLLLRCATTPIYHDNERDQKELQEYVTALKTHTIEKDSVELYYNTLDKRGFQSHSILKMPVDADLSALENVDTDKPVLIVLNSVTKQPHRNGIYATEGIMNYCGQVYGANNVLKIEDPTDQKMDKLIKLVQQKYSHTRFDFATEFEHHGISENSEIGGYFCYKTEESKGKNLWEDGYLMNSGSPILREEELVDWIRRFPGKLSEKRMFISECSVDLKAKNSPLRKLGLVIAPAPVGFFNYQTNTGELGKETIKNMYSFNPGNHVDQQRKEIKDVLKETYDLRAPTLVKQTQAETHQNISSDSEMNAILSDPDNQIYINTEIVFSGQKVILKKETASSRSNREAKPEMK